MNENETPSVYLFLICPVETESGTRTHVTLGLINVIAAFAAGMPLMVIGCVVVTVAVPVAEAVTLSAISKSRFVPPITK